MGLDTISNFIIGVIAIAIVGATAFSILGKLSPYEDEPISETGYAPSLENFDGWTNLWTNAIPLITVVVIIAFVLSILNAVVRPYENEFTDTSSRTSLINTSTITQTEHPQKQTYEDYVRERLNVEKMEKEAWQ